MQWGKGKINSNSCFLVYTALLITYPLVTVQLLDYDFILLYFSSIIELFLYLLNNIIVYSITL